MTIKDIIREIIKDEELGIEEKTDLINRFSKASYSTSDYYLKKKEYSDEVELWIRTKNKKGEIERIRIAPENPKFIIEEYKKELKKVKIK